MPAVTAQSAPLVVANARRSPSYGCALRLDSERLNQIAATAGSLRERLAELRRYL